MNTKTEPWPDNFAVFLGTRYRNRYLRGLIVTLRGVDVDANQIRMSSGNLGDAEVTAQQLQRDWDEINPEIAVDG